MAEPGAGQPAASPTPVADKARPPQNRALRMLGLPALPRKLPSRNWLIFWTLTTTISAAIIYDRREKRRATARWAHAVSHLAKEPLPGGNPNALPRKLTILLAAPPGDSLRVAQDHFTEYVKPVLAASGLDWEFVQGRMQGDVRAAVAERLRRERKAWQRDLDGPEAGLEEEEPTDEDIVAAVRMKNGSPQYQGPRGDIVIGRHTWKEYIRGLHEGWLGPLKLPPTPEPEISLESTKDTNEGSQTTEGSEKNGKNGDVKKEAEEGTKPKRPPQPKPHNYPEDYPISHLPLLIPAEFSPSAPVSFPHILGFLNTPTRTRRFFNRRALADQIGREVAAACLCTYREYRELDAPDPALSAGGEAVQYEQQLSLAHEEKDWLKSVWQEEKPVEGETIQPAKDKVWPKPIVMDSRIATRMRRFELQPEDESRALSYVVPEKDIEGWVKGTLRQFYHWGAERMFRKEETATASLNDSD